MKKLLLLAILLPCLLAIADVGSKVLVVFRNTGEKIAVNVDDIDSLKCLLGDDVDESLFVFGRDTDSIFVTDTLWQTLFDTITNEVHDTLIVRDTLVMRDTLTDTLYNEVRDTLTDTLEIHDTLTVTQHDTVTVHVPDWMVCSDRNPWYVNLENAEVSNYMHFTTYPDDDYSFSKVEEYLADEPYRTDCPVGVTIGWEGTADSLVISESSDMENALTCIPPSGTERYIVYNLIPGRHYYWQVMSGGKTIKESDFDALGSVRMINLKNVYNVRDIGGKPTANGKKTAYGKFFRGGQLDELTQNDSIILVDTLGVTYELDIRNTKEEGTSPYLGENVGYIGFEGQATNKIIAYSKGAYFAAVTRKVLEELRDGKVIYCHCGGGADRTGAVALLLEGVAGCSESDIAKDFELTSFSRYGLRERIDGINYNGTIINYATTIKYLKKNGKDTFQDNVKAYLITHGMTEEELTELENLLTE